MNYPSIRIEGQIFSGEMLQRLDQADTAGQRPADFGLPPDARVKDEILRVWAAGQSYYRAFHQKTANGERRTASGDGRKEESPLAAPGSLLTSLTSETRNLWLIPLLSLLGYKPEFYRAGETINGKLYPISHRSAARGDLPLHLLGWNLSLDKRRDDGAGPRMSPHALVQEYLNVTEHLYGLVANGRALRLLRDSTRLVRQSFIEFDLERMFDEDLFADFAVLFRLLHASRMPAHPDQAAASLVEHYHQDALDQGARIREGLRKAVEQAILGFANGFLAHPDNETLRAVARASGERRAGSGEDEKIVSPLAATDFYNQLLRLIYRFLFLMVTEERRLIFPDSVPAARRDIYDRHYSLQRIRRLAEKPHLADRRHKDLWLSILATFRLFEAGGPGGKMDIAPLAGDLFSPEAIGLLNRCSLDNGTVLDCLRALSLYWNADTRQVIRVNYAALNVEEFGSVYEGLLEYEPTFSGVNGDGGGIRFAFVQGDERSATGSHYTPDELVQPLIRHSLDYLINERVTSSERRAGRPEELSDAEKRHAYQFLSTQPYGEAQFLKLWSDAPLATRRSLLAEKALLSLRVCDPACGSGHILLAAARRIATELAIVRTGEEQPSPMAFRAAVRDVIRECIYGVDLNPLAVELCKVALWLEAHNPGQPLNFLDHHVKCGNAIVGYARREDVERGVPDEAFKTLPGDDKDTAASLRKQNKADQKERKQQRLDFSPAADRHLDAVLRHWREVSALPERTPAEIAAKKARYERFIGSADAFLLKEILAIPIAQFYLPKTDPKKLVTDADFQNYWTGRRVPQGEATAAAFATAVRKRFFHWFLEFPEIFQPLEPPPPGASNPWNESSPRSPVDSASGFDVILGNPPYLGGQALSGTYGHPFCEYVKWEYAPAGLSDLVAYFVRRIYSLLRPGGFTAFITTNSIKDGDIRKDGLEQVLAAGGSINMAVRGIKWPGRANLVVSLLALHKGDWKGRRVLDGQEVSIINAYFEDSEAVGEPSALRENADKVFQGSIFLGDGFLLTYDEAERLRKADPKNDEVIYPIINGQELNNDPEQRPGRCIINFHDWPLEKAHEYDEPFAIVKDKVKPVREADNMRSRREKWWQFGALASGLYDGIEHLPHCFAAARTTKHLNFSALPADMIFSDAVYVFTTDRWDLYAVVQSTIHEIWARKYSGALKQDLRYSPSKCFDTFPFPVGMMAVNPLAAHPSPELAAIGEQYHEYRRALMRGLWLGLTDIYNLFHDPEVSSERRAASGGKSKNLAKLEKHLAARPGSPTLDAAIAAIEELRRLHVELDHAVLAAYGWPDLALAHDFRDVETLPENDRLRYTLSPETRKELLARLLAETHRRAKTAATAALQSASRRQRSRGASKAQNQSDLFQSVEGL